MGRWQVLFAFYFAARTLFLARRCGAPLDEGFFTILKAFFLYRLFPKDPPRRVNMEGRKIRQQSGLDDFLFVLFIHCAGDAQYRWGDDILVCACGLWFLSFFLGDLVGRVY